MERNHDQEKMMKSWTEKGMDRKNGYESPGKSNKEWKGSWKATFETYQGEGKEEKAELEELLRKKLTLFSKKFRNYFHK